MKIVALIEAPHHVCYRYRIEPFTWALAERGLYVEAVPIRKGGAGRVKQLLAVARADAVILQRKLLPAWQLALLRVAAGRLIYDFDDAMFQHDSFHPKGPVSRVRSARFRATLRAADAVIAGNDYLGRSAKAHIDPHRVHVVPTCVEPKWYLPATHWRTGSAVRLVWIGQSSTLQSLQCAREHLEAAARRLPGLQLRVICDQATELDGLRVVARPWSSATEAAELAEGDIGIAWLPDDTWSRGKCGLKVLQFMAAGLPVVANPVGENRRLVIHGETGYLASTPQDWAAAIARLAANPALRRRMGAAGRRLVEERYSVTGWEPRWVGLVEAIIRGAPVPAETRPEAAIGAA
jgi:glycosyltransferase involved in cell wall biosynthesis